MILSVALGDLPDGKYGVLRTVAIVPAVTRRRALRVTAIGSAVVAVIAVVVVVVLTVTIIRRPLPDRGGQVSMPGMTGSASVIRDDQGVPQIYADNATDLFRVQGYVNAEDEFFQMDLRRHITAGR